MVLGTVIKSHLLRVTKASTPHFCSSLCRPDGSFTEKLIECSGQQSSGGTCRDAGTLRPHRCVEPKGQMQYLCCNKHVVECIWQLEFHASMLHNQFCADFGTIVCSRRTTPDTPLLPSLTPWHSMIFSGFAIISTM